MADKPPHLKIVKGHPQKAACPLCHQPAEALYRPFCSRRCADIDLGRWFQGRYAIPAVDAADDSIIETLAAADLPDRDAP